ncbi:uncharacterized protein LOC108912740 [Anoplophora glabripennis]|uniref:uncharacterized protein LOC108912740 n=1 Tax=Anoplophora glabripennis TaxID=217634 RepID=UPI0008744256|nr:uncharacterized protein LOC108912740 [Anoplophora glabripennis]
MGNNEDSNDLDKYIYLDFNGKLSSDVFQNEVFLRIANLHKKDPLIQVNDTLFKGTYDQSIGTNLFFEETDVNSHTGNAFEKQTSICLKYLQSSTKLLDLQQVKFPQKKANIQNEIKNINYNLNWDYNELLRKLENGTLQIEDISAGELPPEAPPQKMEVVEEEECEENYEPQNIEIIVEAETEPELDEIEAALEGIKPINILEKEYEQLNVLARRPVKRAVSPELVAECDEKYKEVFEYHNIERQILQPRDGFRLEVVHVDEDTLSNCIDIDRCILHGLIPESSDLPRVLTKLEKEKLLTLENFDNLSLAGRYYVLQNIVSDLQKYVKNATPKELQDRDEYGRTVLQTLKIYEKLTAVVKNRLQEIKSSLETETV